MNKKLSVNFLGKTFINPFILAASPCTDEVEMIERAFDKGWAGAVLKTTNMSGMKGKLAFPLISNVSGESKISSLGNIDLTSVYSIGEVVKRVMSLKKKYTDRMVAVGISGSDKNEWQELAKKAAGAGADFIECSFSCPQGSLGLKSGQMLGQDEKASVEVASWIKNAAGKTPVVIKLTPQVSDIVSIAKAVKNTGVNAVCLGNTIPGIAGIDLDDFSPIPKVDGVGTYAGISGLAIKPISLRAVALASKANIEVIASGGAMSWRDALEFILLGSPVVEFCTAPMLQGSDIINDMCNKLVEFMDQKGISNVKELIGKSLPKLVDHSSLNLNQKIKAKINSDICIKCGKCYVSCSDGGHMAIEFSKDKGPIVDNNKCVGCGLCKTVCPVSGCIKVEA